MRVLICGWASLADGEATAGDVLALDRVAAVLTAAGIANVACASRGVRPGAPDISAQDPADFTHLVFVCGPIHGDAITALHRRFDRCVRIAVGVSVIDPADATVTGFAAVIARDGLGPPRVDLAAGTAVGEVPVVGFVQAPGQPEYGDMRRHDRVHAALAARLDATGCAVVPVDTRLGIDPGAMFRTPAQLDSLLGRLDSVVSTRLHGLVLPLRVGVPVVAVDPVFGGGKVTAQARATAWPALIPAAEVLDDPVGAVDPWLSWALSDEGRRAAACTPAPGRGADPGFAELLEILVGKPVR